MMWRENRKKADKEASLTKGTPVTMCTAIGEKIKTFSGMHEAGRQTGCDARLIHKCCKQERKLHGGYGWIYAPKCLLYEYAKEQLG